MKKIVIVCPGHASEGANVVARELAKTHEVTIVQAQTKLDPFLPSIAITAPRKLPSIDHLLIKGQREEERKNKRLKKYRNRQNRRINR